MPTSWLRQWLRDFDGGVLAVSHDRAFLENVCRQVVDLDPSWWPGARTSGASDRSDPSRPVVGARFTGGDLGVHGDKMKLNGPIDDIQLRAWGIQLVDGRMPGFCAVESIVPSVSKSHAQLVGLFVDSSRKTIDDPSQAN